MKWRWDSFVGADKVAEFLDSLTLEQVMLAKVTPTGGIVTWVFYPEDME